MQGMDRGVAWRGRTHSQINGSTLASSFNGEFLSTLLFFVVGVTWADARASNRPRSPLIFHHPGRLRAAGPTWLQLISDCFWVKH